MWQRRNVTRVTDATVLSSLLSAIHIRPGQNPNDVTEDGFSFSGLGFSWNPWKFLHCSAWDVIEYQCPEGTASRKIAISISPLMPSEPPIAHNQTIWHSIGSCMQEATEDASAYLTAHGLYSFQWILLRNLGFSYMSKVFSLISVEKSAANHVRLALIYIGKECTISWNDFLQRHKGQMLLSRGKMQNQLSKSMP